MRIEPQAHFLAEAAESNRDGTFLIRKGGITEINASSWPARAKFVLVTRLELDVEAGAHLHHLTVRIDHEAAGEITGWRQPLAAKVRDVGRPIYVNTFGTVEFIVPTHGLMTITASVDDVRLPTLHLLARTVPGAGTTSPPLLRVLPPFKAHGQGKRQRRRR